MTSVNLGTHAAGYTALQKNSMNRLNTWKDLITGRKWILDCWMGYLYIRLPIHRRILIIDSPSYRYYDVILNGLCDCWGTQIDKQEIRTYLNQCIMDDTTLKVTETIRTGTHCLTNQEIMNLTGYDRNMVHTAVQWLIGKGMICQDGRSVHMHHALDDPQAFFHTVKGYCARDLLDAMLSGK